MGVNGTAIPGPWTALARSARYKASGHHQFSSANLTCAPSAQLPHIRKCIVYTVVDLSVLGSSMRRWCATPISSRRRGVPAGNRAHAGWTTGRTDQCVRQALVAARPHGAGSMPAGGAQAPRTPPPRRNRAQGWCLAVSCDTVFPRPADDLGRILPVAERRLCDWL